MEDRRGIHHPTQQQVLAVLAYFYSVVQVAAAAAAVLVVVETTVKPVAQSVALVQCPAAVVAEVVGLLLWAVWVLVALEPRALLARFMFGELYESTRYY